MTLRFTFVEHRLLLGYSHEKFRLDSYEWVRTLTVTHSLMMMRIFYSDNSEPAKRPPVKQHLLCQSAIA
jgi:hypothetical protein